MAGVTLLQHRANLVAALAPLLAPSKIDVKPHPGRFDLGELQRYAVEAPCVRIAVTDFDDDGTAAPEGEVSVAAYLVTKHGRLREGDNLLAGGANADEQNLLLGTALLCLAKAGVYTTTWASAPKKLAYRNLYSGPVGDLGVTLGSVSWRQPLSLAALSTEAELVPFLVFHGDIDVAPADGNAEAEVTVELEQ